MNIATAPHFTLPLLAQATAPVATKAADSTVNLLSRIPENTETALNLSNEIAKTFTTNPHLKLTRGILL